MASAKCLELPAEIWVEIFKHLFRNASVEVWFNHVDIRLRRDIFYVCKQLSSEARSTAKDCIELRIRTGSSLEKISEATRSYYLPHIQRLELSSTKPTPGLDLSLFASLKRITISNDIFPYGSPRYTSFKVPFAPNENSVHAILAGILDERLKRCDKEEYAARSNWFTQALQDPDRSFQVVVTALLSWEEPRATRRANRVNGFLTVKYDLDTLKTVQRTARRTPMGLGHHITWKNGHLETVSIARKKNVAWTWKCVSKTPYMLDESLHDGLLEAELVRVRR